MIHRYTLIYIQRQTFACTYYAPFSQLIMGGKKHSISAEEHVYAAVQLYVDVVYIFMAILSLGKR